uniref:SPIN-DOC-like zinc-finger domain-containing protein n=1 Tax=Latimeria chalumnae TaxID=7897 RepID=H3A6Z4_LATCH
GKKHRDVAEERASRPGKSRIPGKDHRRYYHSVWRTEYLMDFDPRRHGMICMVCGSSLATLKLSTIKRHIWQRHPDSLYWSEEEKEVIRTSWEAHLSVEAQFGPFKLDEDVPECVQYGKGRIFSTSSPFWAPRHWYYNGVPYKRKWCSESALLPKQVYKVVDMKWRSDQQLNGSLQNWFKWEFLMDYDSRNNLLICIMCRNSLPTLNLDEIKQHIMEMHPDLLSYTTEDKRRILECWTNETQLETEVASSTPEGNSVKTIKTEVNTESTEAPQYAASYPEVYGSYNCPQETQLKTEVAGSTLEGNGNMKGGAVWCLSPRRGRVPGKDHRRYYQERWRMDYLMEYDCVKHGLLCMVCGSALATLKVSTIKRHIQQKHPNSSFLSPAIKEMIVEEWSKKASQLGLVVGPLQGSEGPESLQGEESSKGYKLTSVIGGAVKPEVAVALDVPTAGLPENGILVIKEELTGQGKRQRGHYPGKEQRRNYQVRWRSEYLMDYDCQRHGLICMVCGGALATLKVSTIKRHILQVHPHSLELSPEEKQKILEFYNQNAL